MGMTSFVGFCDFDILGRPHRFFFNYL
jgi:hypothetical protein